MVKQIYTDISTQVLTYTPGGSPTTFTVTVHNNSDRFAAFRVELSAAGSDLASKTRWYRLVPEVSYKIPAGDRTQFQVEILAVPPVPDGFTGTMNLTVRVFSLELRDEDRLVLRMVVEGSGFIPPRVELPLGSLKGYPGDRIECPVIVTNLNRQSVDVALSLYGLEQSWVRDGAEKHLHIPAKEQSKTSFVYQVPDAAHAPSRTHSLIVEARQAETLAVQTQTTLTILPSGFVEFQAVPIRQQLPMGSDRGFRPFTGEATYELRLVNQSNLPQHAHIDVQYAEAGRKPLRWRFWNRSPQPQQAPSALAPGLTLSASEVDLAVGETVSTTLFLRRPLPWLGWSRVKELYAKTTLTDTRLDLRNDSQTLELEILPLIPFWLQLVGGLLALIVLLVISRLLGQQYHRQPVTTVQFNGQGDEVISAAEDGQIRRWRIDGADLLSQGVLYQNPDDKAIRVVRYRRVNNDQIAVGFENGEIQIQNLLLDQQQPLFSYRQDDRVFDLAWTQDARSLYSGHGSGLVLRWDLQPGSQSLTEPAEGFDSGFAVQAIAPVGDTDEYLAIAGRFNRLVLLNLETGEAQNLIAERGSPNDYIQSLATASHQPDLLATADNRGNVTVWNVRSCLRTPAQPCEPLDQWTVGAPGAIVRAIALSPDGCYLVSAGDDHSVMLWPLTRDGNRQPAQIDGISLFRSVPQAAVDIIQQQQRILVVAGGNDGQVRLHTMRLRPTSGIGRCNTTIR